MIKLTDVRQITPYWVHPTEERQRGDNDQCAIELRTASPMFSRSAARLSRSGGLSLVALLRACLFDDMAGIRLFNSRVYVRRPVAGARLPGATLAAKFFAPGPIRVVLADKA
ncbi:hypothetical protein IVB57_02420 [Bradyrhizobium sp. CW9]|uniref:hypothetical protein n=1 Tax=Bradyrhizobium sp. CW9 TaxID=2782689 RepID=UPI001FF86450|nr:hypothetical protein [Bradyrhizobium sp. CW9]MCK1327255.1 hypothetical protein [Bradyrhizobium sp. CW9]